MSPARRVLLATLSFCLFAASVALCPEVRAQNQNASPDSGAAQSGPKKPVRKPDQVKTNDPVAQLAVKRAPEAAGNATEAQAPPSAEQSSDATTASTEETEKKAAEIASLEKQIQDKTKRITFLMRLFVTDERPFLNDPANQKVDETAQDRRKYEQDELLWETAELAKLKARLNEIKAAK